MNIARAKTHLPDFPAEVFDIWLAPLVRDAGWPFITPDSYPSGHWSQWLLGHSLQFWRSVSWSREAVSFSSEFVFDSLSREHISGIIDAHVRGYNNRYKRDVTSAAAKWQRVAGYVFRHRTVPVPLVLLHYLGSFHIADGCHRIAALFAARVIHLSHDAWVARAPLPNARNF